MLKIRSLPVDPAHHRDGRQDDGHRAAQPRPGQQRLLPPGHPERRQADSTDAQRPRHHGQHQADDERGPDVVAQLVRGDQQAEQDEHADLGDPAEPFGEAAGGGPVRQLRRCPGPCAAR